jgi:hypothetical protein
MFILSLVQIDYAEEKLVQFSSLPTVKGALLQGIFALTKLAGTFGQASEKVIDIMCTCDHVMHIYNIVVLC